MPLVEFVEDDRGDALEQRVAQQPPGQDAFRDVPEPRARAGGVLEADLEADQVADAFASLVRHPSRGGAGSEPPRLEDDHLSLGQIEQRWRHARRLARAGRRLDHHGASAPQR